MPEKIKVVIVDTGVDTSHPLLSKCNIDGCTFKVLDNGIHIFPEYYDDFGHGTAITSIIANGLNNTELYIIKIFNEQYYCQEESLIAALNYIDKNIPCNIINLSLGLNVCMLKDELHQIIIQLKSKGITIISAFNNDGSLSYPAAFSEVIGVDTSDICTKTEQFEFVENSLVNIRAKGNNQRVAWLGQSYRVLCGNSFAAAHISVVVGRLLRSGVSSADILDALKNKSIKVHKETGVNIEDKLAIKKAAIFPFNKEIHSLARYSSLLFFDIYDFFDIRESGNIGRSLRTFDSDKIIKNIESINWEDDFDTVVLGHTNMIERITGKKIKERLIQKCAEFGKNVYSFDYIKQEDRPKNIKIFCPTVDLKDVPQNRFGKLFHPSKPVIGVFGTGSKQGKFSLQLELRKRFLSDNYYVGQLGTEPSSLLFDFDYVYPMGYGNTVSIQGFHCISVLNDRIHSMCDKNEVIIVGCQSNTIPVAFGNECYYTTKQYEFLLGTEPDICILCINAHDDLNYISRTIHAMESIVETTVIAVVLFPQKLKNGWMGINGAMESVTEFDRIEIAHRIEEKHHIPLFSLDNQSDIDLLYQMCINYFVEE